MDTDRTAEATEEQSKQYEEYQKLSSRQKKKFIPKRYRFSNIITGMLTNTKQK